MTRHPNAYRVSQLRQSLKPFRLHFFTTLRSTNDHAAAMRRRGDLFAPAVVLAARQTAGRGRGTNTWFSAPGSITVTFVLPVLPALAPHHLPLAAGLAVRNAVAEVAGDDGVQLKWPNDLLYRGRKLAGLLCERLDKVDLVGLGVNVNVPPRVPKELRERVVFLEQVAGRPLDLTDTLATVARHLHRMGRNADAPFPALLREYDRHHALVGRRVRVVTATNEPPIIGRCEGLDDTGRLLVRAGKDLHRVIAGHVELG